MAEKVFEQLLQYTRWANETVLSLAGQYGDRFPPSSLRLLSHIINAQTVWADRINGHPLRVAIWDVHDLETCRRRNTETLQVLGSIIANEGNNLDRRLAYTNLSGQPWETSLSDMLLQLFNHGTYHRAQIALDLRQNGLEAVNTDYITFSRLQ